MAISSPAELSPGAFEAHRICGKSDLTERKVARSRSAH